MDPIVGQTGKLYLVPSLLGESAPITSIPPQTLELLQRIDHLVVESPKQARRFLQRCGIRVSTRPLDIRVLDEHSTDAHLPDLLAPALAGHDQALLSDAGCPGVADPGARLVMLAHARGVEVVPLVGPSAILLALMASGLNGQHFAFHGYLPIEPIARRRALTALEKEARTFGRTQIFIETPYRNGKMLAAILATCAPDTILAVAADITLPTQFARTRTIQQWRDDPLPDLERRPAVFLVASGA